MKTLKLTAIFCLMLGTFVSCRKNSNSPNATSTDEAADLITASLSVSTNGALSSFNDLTVSAQTNLNIDSACGVTWADSVNRNIAVGSGYSYTYKGKYTYSYLCTPNLGGTVNTTSNYTGSFTNPNLTSTFSGSSVFVLTGVSKQSTQFVLTGDYKRSGSFQSKADTSFEGTHTIDITITNLTLVRPLRVIKSGSATFNIEGDMPRRGAFTYTGTIVFNGGDNATLTVNGTVYLVNLATGAKKRG